jgi:hypothetical protein
MGTLRFAHPKKLLRNYRARGDRDAQKMIENLATG